MIWYMIWYVIWYMIWYYMIYDIWYMIYDTWYGMIWCDMIWYDMIWYDMIWYDMIRYDMIYDTCIWYMIWYMMIWYDMIWYMIFNNYSMSSSRTWADSQCGAEHWVGNQLIMTRVSGIIVYYIQIINQPLFNSRISFIPANYKTFGFVVSRHVSVRETNTRVHLYERFQCFFWTYNYLKFFFIFVNLPLRILTPYSVAFFVFSGFLLFQKEPQFLPWSPRQTSPRLNFSTHRIWAEILVVKEPIRELRCHYLVTYVYNDMWYMIWYDIWYDMIYDMIWYMIWYVKK